MEHSRTKTRFAFEFGQSYHSKYFSIEVWAHYSESSFDEAHNSFRTLEVGAATTSQTQKNEKKVSSDSMTFLNKMTRCLVVVGALMTDFSSCSTK